MKSIDPTTGRPLKEYPDHGPDEVPLLVRRAGEAFLTWRDTSFAERAELMAKAATVLRDGIADYAPLMTREMGKTVVSAEAEVEKCALVCDFYAENAERFLAPEEIASDASRSFVRYDPIGVVLAVMPWNFPFWQVFRFAAPSLMAGNTGLLKHASNVPGCALAIEGVFTKAGFPEGVFATLLIGAGYVADVIRSPEVRAVTLTGSESAGASVAAEAGKALKKSVLELGGSDPFIVLADADIELAAMGAAVGRTINAGQSCIAAKRFIVEAPIFERFEAALTRRMAELRIGDPMDRETDIGPLARPDLVADLEDQVKRSVKAGATLILGGRRREGDGYYYEPTVLTHVTPGMAAFDEETFGPVAALVEARDADHAVELANLSDFGLGASVWTGDSAKGEAMAARIDAGAVFVNGIVKSDPRLPFGGVKRSGYGRELSLNGIREFVNAKTVWVK